MKSHDSLSRRGFLAAGAMAVFCRISDARSTPRTLRVAADPNNLPFTNDKLQGFENELAALIARDLGLGLEYAWRAQRRGFFRVALKDDACDVVMGVPAGFERTLTTVPYYRSSYVFVTRLDQGLKIASFDDDALRRLRIGVQLVGDDGVNTPPAHALAARGMVENLHGFMVFGDHAESDPTGRILRTVADKSIDVAIVWGPLAGSFAKRSEVPLVLTPTPPVDAKTGLLMTFAIAVGVKKGHNALRDRINTILNARRDEIRKILDRHGVPIVPDPVGGRGGR